VLIPLGELPRRYAELPKDRTSSPTQDGRPERESHGISASVGFKRVKNLRGGILTG